MNDDVYVGRHGQDSDNERLVLNGRRNMDLTPLGVQQVNNLADHILETGLKFWGIWASPLKRARQSARILGFRLGIGAERTIVEPDLIEREFGPTMTGQSIERIKKLCKPEDVLETERMTYFLRAEGSEEYPAVYDRAGEVLAKARLGVRHRPLLFVCHSDIGKMLWANQYGKSWKEGLEAFHFGNSELLRLSDKCSIAESHAFKSPQHNF